MSFLDDINKRMGVVRQSKYGVPVGLALATVLSIVLLLAAYYICFTYMLIAIIAYGIPVYFGLKNRKKLVLYGTVLFVVLGLSFGIYSYDSIQNFPGTAVSSSNNALINGTITPVHGLPGDGYTFSVTYVGGNTTSNIHAVATNAWETTDAGVRNLTMTWSGINATAGPIYTVHVATLTEGLYTYYFVLQNSSGNTFTTLGDGPLNAPGSLIFQNSMTIGMLIAFLQIGILFYILVLLTWWMEKSKKKLFEQEKVRQQKKQPTKKEGEVEKFICSDCGVEVPADSDKCPGCGASFDEEDLKCSQCGAKLLKTDTKCWNCGRKL